MCNLQLNNLVDGINSVPLTITEWQALSLIYKFNLELQAKGKEDDFKYIGNVGTLDLEIKYKHSQYSLVVRGSLPKYCFGENVSNLSWAGLEMVKGDINSQLHLDAVWINKGKIKAVEQLHYPSFPLCRVELKADVEVGTDFPYLPSFLKTNLIQHKGKPFNCEDGLVFKCVHENYFLKVYIKGEGLIRFEIVLLTRELRKYKINTSLDLNAVKLKPVAERFKKEFSEIIFGDGINLFLADELTKREDLLLTRLSSLWRNNCYSDTIEKLPLKESFKYKQRMYRLRNECKMILANKGHGYKKYLLEGLNRSVDSCFS